MSNSSFLTPTNSPSVSIIMPNFNCMKFLPDTLQSIKAQSYHNYELIIIDDGSTDASLDWLIQQEQHDPRIKVLRSKRLGPGGARNLGAHFSRGDFLAFVDADDSWHPEKLTQQIRWHESSEDNLLSFTDYQHVLEEGRAVICGCFEFWPHFQNRLKSIFKEGDQGATFIDLEKPTALLYEENVIGTSTVMVRRDKFLEIGGFDTTLASASDWDLWLRLSQLGKIGCSTRQLMHYLVRDGAISRNQTKRLQAVEDILKRYKKPAGLEDGKSIRRAQALLAANYRDFYRQQSNRIKAAVYGLKSLMLSPGTCQLKALFACLIARPSIRLKNI